MKITISHIKKKERSRGTNVCVCDITGYSNLLMDENRSHTKRFIKTNWIYQKSIDFLVIQTPFFADICQNVSRWFDCSASILECIGVREQGRQKEWKEEIEVHFDCFFWLAAERLTVDGLCASLHNSLLFNFMWSHDRCSKSTSKVHTVDVVFWFLFSFLLDRMHCILYDHLLLSVAATGVDMIRLSEVAQNWTIKLHSVCNSPFISRFTNIFLVVDCRNGILYHGSQ